MTNHSQTHDVVIAGGGPTGMMLAAELALARVNVALVERRKTADLPGSRAGGLMARTIEVLDQRGVADRFLAKGKPMQVTSFAGIFLELGDFPTRHNYGLALFQSVIEQIMAEWISELPITILRGREVTGFEQSDGGVDVALSNDTSLRANYLVGCDGGRSLVRKKAGIEFPGWDPSVSYLMAECKTTEATPEGIRRDDKGVYGIGKSAVPDYARIVLREPEIRQGDEVTIEQLREALIVLYGKDFGVHDPIWISRFTDMTRQAASYRQSRVFVAGDAAHIHGPTGGQGLNLGVQDAVNLGWKLAQVVKGISPESLLDTYHAERHPLEKRILRCTMAQTAINRGGERVDALREEITEMLAMEEPRKRWAGMMSGLDVRYDFGDGGTTALHPLLGRRMPDLEVTTDTGPRRVFSFLHEAKPVFLDFTAAIDITPWASRVPRIVATYDGTWELPVLGEVPRPSAVLVRPDGYVVWVGQGTDEGLRDALTRWFGAAP